MIESATITNIKGFGDTNNIIQLNLDSSKVNLLIAPNGFGKSSLAVALQACSEGKTLKIKKEFYHHSNENLPRSFSIRLDGTDLVADDSKNQIAPVITPFVVNSRLNVFTSQRNTGRYSYAEGYMDIENLLAYDNVPDSVASFYRYTALVSKYGLGQKSIPNFSDQFDNNHFYIRLEGALDVFQKFTAKKRKTVLDDTIANVKSLLNTKQYTIPDATFSTIEQEEFYQKFLQELRLDVTKHQENFFLFDQINTLFNSDAEKLRKRIARAHYEIFKANLDAILLDLNSSWLPIQSEEQKEKTKRILVIKFPRADQMSNGQRDVLTMVSQLAVFSARTRVGKTYWLLIDEVFDYLDDANTLVAQYFLSRFVKRDGVTIYTSILTHLSQKYFRNFVFNKDVLNIQFLKPVIAVGTLAMKKYIEFRERLEPKKYPANQSLYDGLSRYFFHYHPDTTIDLTPMCPNPLPQGLKSKWFKGTALKEFVLQETNKYLAGQGDFDPYAICVGIRYRVERLAYDRLTDYIDKNDFIKTKKTPNKLDFAASKGVLIPDSMMLLSIIHNDADHLRDADKDKDCVHQLTHLVVRNTIRHLFDYHGVEIGLDKI